MNGLDPRLIKITIMIDNEPHIFDQRLAITATGMKYANPLQDESEVTIYNMSRSQQDFILTKTSPYTLDPIPQTIIVEAGRQSYGLTEIYRGNIVMSRMSQPPDIGVTLRCLTGNFLKGNIVTVNAAGQASLELVSRQVADASNLQLKFEATNKQVTNAAYGGDASQMQGYLNSMGGLNVFQNGNTLIVKDAFVPLKESLRELSAESGMIGIPEYTEQGLRVKFFIDNKTTIGGALQITSKIYPAVNGRYYIYKLGFDIASRDIPFYYIAEAALFRSTSIAQQ